MSELKEMSVDQLLEVVSGIQNQLQVRREEVGGDSPLNEVVRNIDNKIQGMGSSLEYMRDEVSYIGIGMTELAKIDNNDYKKILIARRKRVLHLMKNYEGSTARNMLYGNIQAMLFRQFNVNKYEHLPKVHYSQIISYIDEYEPTGEAHSKLMKYEVDHEQLDMFDV